MIINTLSGGQIIFSRLSKKLDSMKIEEMKTELQKALKGNTLLNVAYIGIASGLLDCLKTKGSQSSGELAASTSTDPAYTVLMVSWSL